MAKYSDIPPTLISQIIKLDVETGRLFWLPRESRWFQDGQKSASHCASVWNARFAGKECFNVPTRNGYKIGTVFDTQILAHRLIFALSTGAWPTGDVDHIDGDKDNNRPKNLRDVPRTINMRNTCMNSRNKSGYSGVKERAGRWVAEIQFDGRRLYLGTYITLEEAIAARQSAQIVAQFTDRHGRYKRPSPTPSR